MPNYYDPDLVIQGDGSKYQWLNCNCACAAMALDRDTQGRSKTTGAKVRAITGDTSGGTTLAQVERALNSGWPGVDHLEVRYRYPFTDLMEDVDDGHGVILQGGYRPFHAAGLAGSATFYGNHSVFLNEVILVWVRAGVLDLDRSKGKIFDPLWDGRRSYIPSKRWRWVDLRLLWSFAGLLDLGNGYRLGAGMTYAGLTRETPTIPPDTSTAPKPSINYGSNTMIVANQMDLTSSHRMALKKGQRLYREAKAGASVVAKMGTARRVPYFGRAASGWGSVAVRTANFPDKVRRTVILYVPLSAGTISKG